MGCPACSAGCTPPRRTRELTPGWLQTFLERTRSLPFDGFVVWTGGEPFLSFESLASGVQKACSLQYKSEILTSGFWFRHHPERLRDLPRSRFVSLRISLDDEHQRTIPLPVITELIRSALTLDIQVNFTLRDVPGGRLAPSDYTRYLQENFPGFHARNKGRSRWIHFLPTIPLETTPWTPPEPARTNLRWKKPCPVDFKDLVVGEDGLAYPCCGHFATPGHERLSGGDPLKDSWEEIYGRFFGDPFFATLRTRGPHGVCQELNLDPLKWGTGRYQSPCHLCQVVFRKPNVLLSMRHYDSRKGKCAH